MHYLSAPSSRSRNRNRNRNRSRNRYRYRYRIFFVIVILRDLFFEALAKKKVAGSRMSVKTWILRLRFAPRRMKKVRSAAICE